MLFRFIWLIRPFLAVKPVEQIVLLVPLIVRLSITPICVYQTSTVNPIPVTLFYFVRSSKPETVHSGGRFDFLLSEFCDKLILFRAGDDGQMPTHLRDAMS